MRDPRIAEARAWEQYNRATLEQIDKVRIEARAVATGPADVALLKQAIAALAGDATGCWQAFHDEFVASVRDTPERRAAWARVLGDAFAKARDALVTDLLSKGDKAAFDAVSQGWREEGDPFTVWLHRAPHIPFRTHAISTWGHVLLRVEPQAGLRALDTLPYPKLMEEVLLLFCRDDRALIEELLVAAPPAFDAQGAWGPGRSVAALLVTDLITEHARELHDALAYAARARDDEGQKSAAAAAIEDVEQRELPGWMARAFGLLLQRPDGVRIALGYLGYLSRENLLGRGVPRDGTERWTAHSAALAALAATLNQASVSVAAVREAWDAAEELALDKEAEDARRIRVRRRSSLKSDQEGEGARTLHAKGLPLLFGAAVMLGDALASEAGLETFWFWLEVLLEGRDPGLSLITHGASLSDVPQRFGFLLSRLPSPGDRLRAAYARLEPQRRRALFARRYDETHQDLESIVLLRIGLNAAANWLDRVKVGEQADAARSLFFWIYEAARRLWLTAVLDVGDLKKQLVAACFAFMPLLFGDSLGEALKHVVPSIASDARLLADACAMLRLNGVDATRLAALIDGAGGDLAAALRDVRQWSELTGREEDFPQHLQTLTAELGIDFARPAVTPESERTGRLREKFAEVVPWGAALLRRLEADGCSRVRAIPLDQLGSTWVLQVTLPEALRHRFGLPPDLRVLAVHGQIRGHDLRRALEEPEGITEVTSDLLVIANNHPELGAKLLRLAGPWGQRVPWPLANDRFAPLPELLQEHLPAFDLFERRDPVRGRAFLGRRREVDAVASRLLRGQAVGVFGLRKVGKSSLLQAVADAVDPAGAALAGLRGRGRSLPDTPAEALVVWLDVQSLVLRTRDALAEQLWDGLKDRLDIMKLPATVAPLKNELAEGGAVQLATSGDEAPSADPLDNLRRLLLSALGRREVPAVCFILDEYDLLFEGYGGEPAVAGVEQIFALLRSLGQSTGRVSLTLVGRDPVFFGRPHLNGFTNPLLGWVEPFPLGPLSDDDAAELLQRIGKRVGLDVGPATIEFALRWTGGHPLLLRQYGSALREVARGSQGGAPIPTAPLCERAVPVFLRRDAVHTICGEIDVLLETRFPDARALLRSLAVTPAQDARAELERHGAGGGKAGGVLFNFGLLRGTLQMPWLPLLYREFFGIIVPESKTLPRSQSYGS